MGIIVDIILIGIIILNIFIGYKKGLIKVVFNIFAFFIAIVVSLILFKPVSNIIINNTEIDDKIREKILSVNNYDEDSEYTNDENKKTFLEKYIEDKVAEAGKEAKKRAVEAASNVISIKATEIITGLILFIIVRIALILLGFLTDTLSNIPIIKQFNEIGGITYGLAKAIIIIYLLLTIIFIISSMKENNVVEESIYNSYITKLLYENNPIIGLAI